MKAVLASALVLIGKVTKLEITKYLFEILIVFLGVYLAFLLADYQEAMRERDIRVQHYESLLLELQRLAFALGIEEQKLSTHLNVVEDIDQGNRPRIPSSDLLFIYPGFVRDSAFNSRHFEALDSEIVEQIINGSFGLSMLEKQIESFNDQSIALLPIVATNEECCYDEDGQLLAHWYWYPRLVREIDQMIRNAREGIVNNALPDLRETIRQLRNLPPSESNSAQDS